VFDTAIADAPKRLISAVTRVELSFVVEGRKGQLGRQDLEQLLLAMEMDVVSTTPQQAAIAIDAFRRYGKGRHKAAFNISDCFSYALALATVNNLLFKGNDFTHTYVASALGR
jgi:ribonuclease VapC